MLISMQANPVFDRGAMTAVRDPALITQDGVLRCFHTVAEPYVDRYRLYVDVIESSDLRVWSAPRRLTTSDLKFSTPRQLESPLFITVIQLHHHRLPGPGETNHMAESPR